MDELWQRYRTFWQPVLIGVGLFLVGLIVVNILTDDPEEARQRVTTRASTLSRKQEPNDAAIRSAGQSARNLEERTQAWAVRLDQAQLEDPIEHAVRQALGAAILRGMTGDEITQAAGTVDRLREVQAQGELQPGQTAQLQRALEALRPFEGDTTVARQAIARMDEIFQDRLDLLRTGDPNVAFSRFLNDVWSELRLRANRADVELKATLLGFDGVTAVSRATLPQRLLNLALLSQLVDLSIRHGAESVEDIRVETRSGVTDGGPGAFIREWPVSFTMRGDMEAVQPIVAFLTDPDHPIPIAPPGVMLSHPRRGASPLEGIVELQVSCASTLIRPDAALNLDAEEE